MLQGLYTSLFTRLRAHVTESPPGPPLARRVQTCAGTQTSAEITVTHPGKLTPAGGSDATVITRTSKPVMIQTTATHFI